jgi:flavin-dependent dehydrogenase
VENRPDPLLVVGAGPAGSAAARLLSAWGHRVVLVHRAGGEAGRLAESIPPSAQKLLAAIGALPAIEDAGFIRWHGNTVWWAGDSPRVETFAPGTAGYQVQRRALDERLRALAVESGAALRQGLVRNPVIAGLDSDLAEAPDPTSRPSATLDVDGESTVVRAAFILDCSGRAGVLARRGLRVADDTLRTIALAGVWRSDAGWPLTDDSHTLVASYEDGWAWSVPTEPGVRYFTVMIDPERTGLTRGAPSREIYLAELAKVHPFAPVLTYGSLIEGPWGADASTYHARRYAGPGYLLVGDAASSIDPLSSFGVKKALASGWLAAIAVHTAMTRPEMADEALAFFDRRERALHASARRQAVRFAADVAVRTAHPFWSSRAEVSDGAEGEDGPDPSVLARDPSVVAAFDDLRRRPAIRLSVSDAARVAPRAAVRGHEIVLDDHLFLPAWPEGIRYLRGVDLVQLLKLAPAHRDVGDLYRAVTQAGPPVILPDFLGALSALIAAGALVHDSARAG